MSKDSKTKLINKKNHTDSFSEYEFTWREWTAPLFTSAKELRKSVGELKLCGRKIKHMRMIGLSYMHNRDWVEESAYRHYNEILDDKDEISRLSDYDNIDPELMYDRYAQIDEPMLIGFEDGDVLEIICPREGEIQLSMNHIPWDIATGCNLPNEDADNLFSDCINQTISGVEVVSYKREIVEVSKDGRLKKSHIVRDDEGDSADEIIIRFENGCGLSFSAECYDYCAVYSINRNNKANQIPFHELKKGLFNTDDLVTDTVTGFRAESSCLHFGEKGYKHTDEPYMTLSPSGIETAMFVNVDDFLIFAMSIMLIKRDWFDEFGRYEFSFREWQEVLDKAQEILEYKSFDDLFDRMIGLNIIDRNGTNIPLRMLNTRGYDLWNNKEKYEIQLKDMREWTALTMKENETMLIFGF